MNIFVCVKQVPDTETKITPSSDGNYIETTGVKWIPSPYDEFAIEQALLVKAAHPGSTVTALRVGGVNGDSEVLRKAMAMGADDSILVEAPDNLDSFSTAKALAGAIAKSGKTADLIFAGKQAIDTDSLQVPQILAEFLNIPSVSVITSFELKDGSVTAKREIEGGAFEVYKTPLPAIFTCNKALNSPRYASLPGIIKAKKKPLLTLSLSDVGVDDSHKKIALTSYQLPAEKPPGKTFDATDEAKGAEVVQNVLGLLRSEAKVL